MLGLTTTAIFAWMLHLSRYMLIIPYAALIGIFVYAFFRWSGIDVTGLLRHNWRKGILAGIICGALVTMSVLSQPSSPRSEGLDLAIDLVWLGVVYGALDALLQSVIPILATVRAFSDMAWTASWPGKVAVRALTLASSLAVTAAYNLGYPEFQGLMLIGPITGTAILDVGNLLTGNPLSSLTGHIIMHIASVMQGPESTLQLPPHY
jgi:hypothetical protein